MDYNFEYYGYGEETIMPIISTLFAIVLALAVIGGLVSIVMYVLRSLSLYTISKRRGIRNAWLSWFPVGQEWIIGSLSDQYKYLTQGKDQFRRKLLLGLEIAAVVVSAASAGTGIASAVKQLMMFGGNMSPEDALALMVPVMGSAIFSLISAVVGITAYVFRQMSMYDLYKSCDPKNAVLFLVFGILFGITEPFFLLFCRNKDGGMPPRKHFSEEPAAPVNEFDL